MAGMDPATAALIAQLVAEDLSEAYESHSGPIGASWHDYEEPLSSYERQCLDAGNDLDGHGDERCGWGPGDSDEITHAVAPDESLSSTEPAGDGTWNSSFMNGDHQVQQFAKPDHVSQVAVTIGEGGHSDPKPCSISKSEGSADSPTRIEPIPTSTEQACEVRNVSDPVAIPIRTSPVARSGPIQESQDLVDSSDDATRCEPVVPPNLVTANEQPSVSTTGDVEDIWHDGLDYSSHKGKGKAVRAYDEFKLGLRNNELPSRAQCQRRKENPEDDEESEDESKGQSEIDDEGLPFFRVPWPTTEEDELLSRREDASVVEIRVEDDETLESILRDISLKGNLKGIGPGGYDVPMGKDTAGWW